MAQAIYEPDDLAGNSSWDGVKPQQLYRDWETDRKSVV